MVKIVAIVLLVSIIGPATCQLGLGLIVTAANIKYYQYNQPNPTSPVLFSINTIPASTIDSTQSVTVFLHGWETNAQDAWLVNANAALFAKNANSHVITVDWSKYANSILGSLYLLPVVQTRAVGDFVGETLIAVSSAWGVPLANFHLVGHSLGAHIAGFAGQRVNDVTGNKFGRITGLDPAGLGYSYLPADSRLSSDDATLVDTIHTSTLIAGYKDPIGPIDFYPNGGQSQNGCPFGACSHGRAPEYYIESIASSNFIGTNCTSYNDLTTCRSNNNVQNIMGANVNALVPGVFYLNTNAGPPYACGTSC